MQGNVAEIKTRIAEDFCKKIQPALATPKITQTQYK